MIHFVARLAGRTTRRLRVIFSNLLHFRCKYPVLIACEKMAGEGKSMWGEELIRNFLSLYLRYKDLLEARHSIVATEQKKAVAWTSIADSLNANSNEKKNC